MKRVGVGALLGALLFSASAAAGGLEVNPIRLELEPGGRSTSLTLTNGSDESKVVQASAMAWTQSAGQPEYLPTKDVIVTPVLFRIPPNGRQLVRVGFPAGAPHSAREASYRIFLEEVPETRSTSTQIRILVRLGVPLFVAPDQVRDALDWHLQTRSDGKLVLAAANRGNRRTRLIHLKLSGQDGVAIAEYPEPTYILAGSRAEWVLTPSRPVPIGARARLNAESSAARSTQS